MQNTNNMEKLLICYRLYLIVAVEMKVFICPGLGSVYNLRNSVKESAEKIYIPSNRGGLTGVAFPSWGGGVLGICERKGAEQGYFP